MSAGSKDASLKPARQAAAEQSKTVTEVNLGDRPKRVGKRPQHQAVAGYEATFARALAGPLVRQLLLKERPPIFMMSN